jgi:glycine cleavage system aminomethyltransferase T
VLLWAKGVALGSGLEVELRELNVAPLQVQGPKSRDLIRDLFGDATLQLKYYEFINTKLEGIPVIVTRTGWTGELGYELYLLDPARGVDLWNRVMEAGKRYHIAPTGPSDIRRIEAGILNYGIDMTLDNNPYELGLERLVNLDKQAEFIGRDALQRIAKDGVKKKLVGVEISGTKMDLNFTRYPIRVEGKTAGFITSCVHSPRLKKNIGYAMLPIEKCKPGNRVEIDSPDGVRSAVIVPMPFIDPRKEIPKAT